MDQATYLGYAEQGAQYLYDFVHGTILDAGLGMSFVVVMILIGILTLVGFGIKYVFGQITSR